MPELTEGRRLFETEGCRGCHKLNGVGGSIGPDLTEEGASHRSPEWLERHFLAPNAVSAGSAMPNFHFTREQARASHLLHALAHQRRKWASYYSSVRLIPSPEYGRQLFVEKDCIVCHAIGGVGAKTGPDLLGVTKRHSTEWLDEQLVNPQLVYPGSSMPEYDLETNARKALVAFMASATPEDAQDDPGAQGPTRSLPKMSPSKPASRTSRALVARAATAQNSREAFRIPTPRAGRFLRFCMSPTTTPRTRSSRSFATARCLPLDNAAGPTPPLYMPSWKHLLSDEDIHQIVDFLWSKQQKSKESW